MVGQSGRMRTAAPDTGPAPGKGPLELMVECRTSKIASSGISHPVTIHSDWTVATPHDFDAERIAAAFGGYTSCATLVESTIPAFRASLEFLNRRSEIPLRADKKNGWRVHLVDQRPGCCRGHAFTSAAVAAHHMRTAKHLAAQHDVPEWQMDAVMTSAETAWGAWEETPAVDADVARLIRDPNGIAELWRAGIHPDRIPELAGAAAVVEPLPTMYFLGLTYGNVNRRWLSRVMAHRPDPDTATWLTWLDEPQRMGTADDWGLWLGFGISKKDVLMAMRANLPPSAVYTIATLTGWPEHVAAQYLTAWAHAGCSPTPNHFMALKRHGVEYPRPLIGAIDALCHDAEVLLGFDVEPYRFSIDRTELAVMLEILGTRHEVINSLRRGVRTVAGLDARPPISEESA